MESNLMTNTLAAISVVVVVLFWIAIIHLLGGWVIGGAIVLAFLFATSEFLRRL